jgi:hypothetical protein
MRSCLIQALILIVVVFALLWFGLPLGASWLATNALNASGFSGTDTKVEVSSNPPPLLLTGHADRIHITSTQASVGDLHASTLDFSLGNVSLLDRTVGTVDGTLTGVKVPAPDGKPVIVDTATVTGKATSAQATLKLARSQVESLAAQQLKSQTGINATITLAAPNKVTLKVGGQSQPGTLVVKDGELDLVPDGPGLPTATLLKSGDGNPFSLTSVVVSGDLVTLSGTIDMQSLLGL